MSITVANAFYSYLGLKVYFILMLSIKLFWASIALIHSKDSRLSDII